MKTRLAPLLIFVLACSGGDDAAEQEMADGGTSDAARALPDAPPPAPDAMDTACTRRSWYPDCDGDGLPAADAEVTGSCLVPTESPDCPNLNIARWVSKKPGSISSTDCDDDNDQITSATAYYVDCDGDGYAPSTTGSLTACEVPDAPESCSNSNGDWTEIQPVGDAYIDTNESVDCIDDDELVYPGQSAWFTEEIQSAEVGRKFDYNCDDSSRRRYGSSYTCSLTPYGAGYLCSHNPGFSTTTACGQEGSYRSGCNIPGGSYCTYLSTSTRSQECR